MLNCSSICWLVPPPVWAIFDAANWLMVFHRWGCIAYLADSILTGPCLICKSISSSMFIIVWLRDKIIPLLGRVSGGTINILFDLLIVGLQLCTGNYVAAVADIYRVITGTDRELVVLSLCISHGITPVRLCVWRDVLTAIYIRKVRLSHGAPVTVVDSLECCVLTDDAVIVVTVCSWGSILYIVCFLRVLTAWLRVRTHAFIYRFRVCHASRRLVLTDLTDRLQLAAPHICVRKREHTLRPGRIGGDLVQTLKL